jgi:hypothetical protein
MCNCEICTHGRRIQAISEEGNTENMRALIEELADRWLMADEALDLDRYHHDRRRDTIRAEGFVHF